MEIPISEAKGHLTELVRRAEAGDEVVLTRHGKAAVRLVPVHPVVAKEQRRAVMERLRQRAMVKATPGPDGARSQDDLYDDVGLPR
jgi:prevent-host-death family protein